MSSRKLIFILFFSFSLAQNAMSGYGYGSSNDHSSPMSSGLSNSLLPSFKNNVSLSNPASWHNLYFTYLNTSVNVQESRFDSNSSVNFDLSNFKLIIPWKQKMSFGISVEPYFSRKLTMSDNTLSTFLSNGAIEYYRENKSSGGPSLIKFSNGFKLNQSESLGSSLGFVFGSSRYSKNLIVDNRSHLLQSRDLFTGSILDLYFLSSRLKLREKPLIFSMGIQIPLSGINIENESYQAFLDSNNNNYHDTNDFPDIGQALLPIIQKFNDEIKINSLNMGLDYQFSPRRHFQLQFDSIKDSGKHRHDSSIFPSYIKSSEKLSISYAKFAKPLSKDRYSFRSSIFLKDYLIKNLENVNEVGLGLGLGIAFGVVGNQIDIGFNVSKRNGIYLIDEEIITNFSIGLTIGDLWFVKRRET